MTLADMLDDMLDDLPRYFAVVGQSKAGWLGLDPHPPEMVCCVTVEDVREMLRRGTAPTARQEQ